MRDKTTTLREAIAAIPSGARLALGGNTIHRGPCAAVHELIRQGTGGLAVIKTAGAYDIDVLAAAGQLASVSAGFIGFETAYGMAPNYRRGVERGVVTAYEHACYTVIAGLRAAIQGVPFMPVAGMFGSDLLQARDFRTVADPYTGDAVVAVAAIVPDVALIHVQEADIYGNARIVGTRFEDVLMAQAAKRTIITAERIVDGARFVETPELVAIPAIYVDAVIAAPRGAWPTSCASVYDYDQEYFAAYIAASKQPDELQRFLDARIRGALVGAA